MKVFSRTTLLLMAYLVPIHVLAIESLADSQMMDEASSWQEKGRDDFAADIWRKILLTNPTHGEAMVSLALHEMQLGNIEKSRRLYEQANLLKPAPKRLAMLKRNLEKYSNLENKKSNQTKNPDDQKENFQVKEERTPLKKINKETSNNIKQPHNSIKIKKEKNQKNIPLEESQPPASSNSSPSLPPASHKISTEQAPVPKINKPRPTNPLPEWPPLSD